MRYCKLMGKLIQNFRPQKFIICKETSKVFFHVVSRSIEIDPILPTQLYLKSVKFIFNLNKKLQSDKNSRFAKVRHRG